MNSGTLYFAYNNEYHFEDGYFENTKWEENALTSTSQYGVYISDLMDSFEHKAMWHRACFNIKSEINSGIRFNFYTSDDLNIATDKGISSIEDVIKNKNLTITQKEEIFAEFFLKSVTNPNDILLHEKNGRYLWFIAEFFASGENYPKLNSLTINLKNKSWTEFLPEIYRTNSNDFLERYLSIFESLYDDMTDSINNFSQKLNPMVDDLEFLQWLGEWIGTEDTYIWNEKQLRYLISNGVTLYKKRGTKEYISDMIALYTGVKPYIVENYQVQPFKNGHNAQMFYNNLYGESAYQFTVIVNEKEIPTPKEYKTLLRIIENAKPAHMSVNAVVLKPYLFLDKYSYLGINSVLGQYRNAGLTGYASLPFTCLSNDEQQ